VSKSQFLGGRSTCPKASDSIHYIELTDWNMNN